MKNAFIYFTLEEICTVQQHIEAIRNLITNYDQHLEKQLRLI